MTKTSESETGVMTDNYLDVKYEYFGAPDDNGLRLRSVDVWYATKPSPPEYSLVDYKDTPVPGFDADVRTAWTLGRAGQSGIIVYDRDDINGLRELLDRLEQEFDRRDMDELYAEFHEAEAEPETEPENEEPTDDAD